MTHSNREGRLILFVEDDEDAQEIMTLILTGYGFVIARNFTEGLRLAQQRYFDLYILDNWLPDGTGVELCRRIREFDPHTPVLFHSAAAYEYDVQDALSAGAQLYLTKPSSLNELERAVVQLISDARERRFEARMAVLAAIREELAIRTEEAKGKRLRAEEKALRAKAKAAFLAAQGTRGDFARLWPSIYLREIRHSDKKSSAAFGA